jgi:hypothetical protein
MQGPPPDKPKREAILDLSKYVDERIRVKFTGGREGIVNNFSTFSPSLTSRYSDRNPERLRSTAEPRVRRRNRRYPT